MFSINCNLGSDMSGNYFVQCDGNKKHIEKFISINRNGGDVQYHSKKYTYEEIMTLNKFKDLFDDNAGHNDNVELLLFTGKFRVPDIDDEDELEQWWEDHLGDTKYPKWKNIAENVIDLME
jgi:hypothetical protein